jgi:hypothetical protein
VVVPIPPREIDKVPVVALLTFKLVTEAPDPVNVLAVIYIADIVMPLKVPLDAPPVQGKKLLNVEGIHAPFLYNSLQFILPETSKI